MNDITIFAAICVRYDEIPAFGIRPEPRLAREEPHVYAGMHGAAGLYASLHRGRGIFMD